MYCGDNANYVYALTIPSQTNLRLTTSTHPQEQSRRSSYPRYERRAEKLWSPVILHDSMRTMATGGTGELMLCVSPKSGCHSSSRVYKQNHPKTPCLQREI